jgi:hypothetical protein
VPFPLLGFLASCHAAKHQNEMVKLCSQPASTGSQLVPCA